MCENGWLSPAEFARATSEPPHLRRPERQFRAPHFVDFVLRQVEGSGTIRTTLDLDLNRYVEGQLREQLTRLHALNVTNGAAVVIDNASGDVLALVGSENYFSPAPANSMAPRRVGRLARRSSHLPISSRSSAAPRQQRFIRTFRLNSGHPPGTTAWITTSVVAPGRSHFGPPSPAP
jgi:membrane carboxypeptidase/penicillin-binding protein